MSLCVSLFSVKSSLSFFSHTYFFLLLLFVLRFSLIFLSILVGQKNKIKTQRNTTGREREAHLFFLFSLPALKPNQKEKLALIDEALKVTWFRLSPSFRNLCLKLKCKLWLLRLKLDLWRNTCFFFLYFLLRASRSVTVRLGVLTFLFFFFFSNSCLLCLQSLYYFTLSLPS